MTPHSFFPRYIAAAAIFTGLATAALAHSGASGLVRDRMVAMSAMGDAIKGVAPMMSGETPFDAEAVRAAAIVIQDHAGDTMTALFPEDNANEASYVNDSIWQDWDRFTALADQLETYGEGLELAAANGLASSGSGTGADAGTAMGAADSMGDVSSMMGTGDMMGTSDMMGTGAMMGTDPAPETATAEAAAETSADITAESLADLPADEVFAKLSATCSACHTKFRKEGR